MNKRKGISTGGMGLIWFGAAVSMAEIQAGTYLAPLGLTNGILAVVIGHIIGCILLFFAGLIGAKSEKSSMETVKICFGEKGGLLFAVLNIIQLTGWTAIMIYDGALMSVEISNTSHFVWCLVIGGFIIIWLLIGINKAGIINSLSMGLLFILTIVMTFLLFKEGSSHTAIQSTISFGAAVELSAAMPLSWLPLISDYTSEAVKKEKSALIATSVYGIVSCWMYVVGMGAAIFTGESDIAGIMIHTGLGILGLIIIIISTVTTTYLDAYSAGVSSISIVRRGKAKNISIAVAVVGICGAAMIPMDDITGFLYFIGSVFAPMVTIQIADYFIKRRRSADRKFDIRNLTVWLAGFIIYRILMQYDIAIGNTLPDIIFTVFIYCIINMNEIKGRN